MEESILRLIMLLPVLVPAIAVHEFGHAWMADRCGDDTPRRQGRVTLDPLQHFEIFGTLMIIMSSLSGIGFGWGRPVIVNPRNFHVPRRDDILVTAAGPAMNILQAALWFILLLVLRFALGRAATDQGSSILGSVPQGVPGAMIWISSYGILINLVMFAFNLIPIPPLDGSRIVAQLSPPPVRDIFYQLEGIGPFILLMALRAPGLFEFWSEPAMRWGSWLIDRACGL